MAGPWTMPGMDVLPAGGDDFAAVQAQQDANKALRDMYLSGADQTSGAPFSVRWQVETQNNPADRLAMLQHHYPDARPLPGQPDNFVYTDTSGRRMLYNPTGLSLGDITSAEQPAASLLGGWAGGVAGTPLGPLGSAAGFGVGSTAGSEALGAFGRSVTGVPEQRTPLQIGAQDVLQAGAGTGLSLLGSAVGSSPASAAVTRAAKDLDDAGYTDNISRTLPAGVVGGAPARTMETGLETTAGGYSVTRAPYITTTQKIGQGVQNVANDAAGAGNTAVAPNRFAQTVNDIANDNAQYFEVRRNSLDNAISNAVGADAPVDLGPLRTLRANLQAELSQSPRTAAGRLQPAIARIDNILQDAGDQYQNGVPVPGAPQTGTLPFDALRNARTDLGQELWPSSLKRGVQPVPQEGAVTPGSWQSQNQVYGALDQAIGNRAAASGPAAQDAYNDYMGFVRDWRQPLGAGDSIKLLQDPNQAPGYLLDLAQSSRPKDQSLLASFVGNASPAQREELTGGLINQLGMKDNQFNLVAFAKDWQRMDPQSRAMLFGSNSPQAQALDNLSTVTGGMRDAGSLTNWSGTARAMLMGSLIGATASDLREGDLKGAAENVGYGLAGTYMAGRALQSVPFVKWLTGSIADPTANWGRSIARLGDVAVADPTIARQVQALQQRMQQTTPPATAAVIPPGGQAQ